MNYYPFDSRNTIYKSIYGAIASETSLKLRLLLHKDAKVHKSYLCITKDGEDLCKYLLEPKEWLGDYRFFDTELSFTEGLYWYYFYYESDYGTFKVTKSENSLGIVSNDGDMWQLTVYDKEFKTPEWLLGGIIYQIFLDRFYRSSTKKNNVPRDRYLENDWNAVPEFRQENTPKFLGNDYFGGDLKGIKEKLSYIASLGVTAIYLNPIFEAHSNHRYNTADYMKIDSLLGTEDDFRNLCTEAKKYGIGIILDGVFSHTGDDSIYFNKYNRYNEIGAFNSKESKYFSWYNFQEFPNKYSSWWGISTLPEVNENNETFLEYITGINGVVRYWLKLGVMGWRLDVADELPDLFLDKLRIAVKEENSQAFILGEVWEDATTKISHSGRRRFLTGKQLDSVMNYPFANAIIKFLKGGNSRDFLNLVLNILENYPPQCVNLLMNHIGTHDTARILTALSSDNIINNRDWQSKQKLSNDEYSRSIKLLKLAATLQYTLPGVPSLFYGDEAGVEGYSDPFCRKTYPWGNENHSLLNFYKKLGNIRTSNICFKEGKFIPVCADMGHLAYIRESLDGKNVLLIAVNRWCDDEYINLPTGFENCKVLIGNAPIGNKLKIGAENICILKKSV